MFRATMCPSSGADDCVMLQPCVDMCYVICVHGRTTCQPDLTTFQQPRHIPTQGYNITQSSAPDDEHMVARNMLSNYQKRNKNTKSDIQLVFLIHTISLHVSTIDQSSSGLFCQLCHKMLRTVLGSHRVYIHAIHEIKSFVSKGVTSKLCCLLHVSLLLLKILN